MALHPCGCISECEGSRQGSCFRRQRTCASRKRPAGRLTGQPPRDGNFFGEAAPEPRVSLEFLKRSKRTATDARAGALDDRFGVPRTGYRVLLLDACLTPACTGSQSVGERTVNQLLDQLAIVGADRARCLAHVDSDEFKATVVRDNMRVPSSWPPLSNICEKRR